MKTPLYLSIFTSAFTLVAAAGVRVEDVPEKGLQPDTTVSSDGTVHLVYLKGDPGAAEVRYTFRKAGQPWQPPSTVNSIPGSAIAIGTIRGPQLALSEKDILHVLWNGTGGHGDSSAPLWYTRKAAESSSFEKQRDLLGGTTALDGGASITANGGGGVSVVWHGNGAGSEPEENERLVFARHSKDGGVNFEKAQALNDSKPGICACCSLRAFSQNDGTLNVFFRNAAATNHRAMTLLKASKNGPQIREVETWNISACPMSSAALAEAGNSLFGAWETAGKIRAGNLSNPASPAVTAASKEGKHPAIAVNSQGRILIAWVEGSGWNKGGSAAWREYDRNLQPAGDSGKSEGVPAWGKVAVYAEPQGDFVVLR